MKRRRETKKIFKKLEQRNSHAQKKVQDKINLTQEYLNYQFVQVVIHLLNLCLQIPNRFKIRN